MINYAPPADPDSTPGTSLPDSFDKTLFNDDQLIELEESWQAAKRHFIRTFYTLLRVHPRSHTLTMKNLLLNAAILNKLLGMYDESISWSEIARASGVHPSYVRHNRTAMLKLLKLTKI